MDKESLNSILFNCYRKFKKHIHFANNMEYLKVDLAAFEENKEWMHKRIDEIAQAILDNDPSFFAPLIKKIKTKVFAKSFAQNKENPLIVSNVNANSAVVSKVNFFISAPIELFIVDTFWATLFGQFLDKDPGYHAYCYANKTHHSLFFNGEKSSISTENVDYRSLELFELYYPQYLKWKNDALRIAKYVHKDGKDASIVCFDFSRFYYSVNIDFKKIRESMEKDFPTAADYECVTCVIENLYRKYSSVLRKYDYSIKENQIILPIGLVSSSVLSNYYLLDFDKNIANTPGVVSYGRYVDDVLLVLKDVVFESFEDLIHKKFEGLFFPKNDSFFIKDHFEVRIQKLKPRLLNCIRMAALMFWKNYLRKFIQAD